MMQSGERRAESGASEPRAAANGGPNREEQLLTTLLVHAERHDWTAVKDILRKREVRLIANLLMLASTDEWERLAHLLRLHERALVVKYEGPQKLDVTRIGLSARTSNLLMESGITTAAELARCTRERLRNIKNMGDRTIEEIVDALGALDLSLTPEAPGESTDDFIPKRLSGHKNCPSPEARAEILDMLKNGAPVSKQAMRRTSGLKISTLDHQLKMLIAEGTIVRESHGVYSLAENPA